MLATIPSATVLGARGRLVDVEVHVGGGLPGHALVGLPDAACREGIHRVRAALQSCRLEWPGHNKRMTISLVPPGVRKLGSGLDLAIAVAALVAGETVGSDAVRGIAFVGELGLDGRMRSVPGVLPMVAALAATDAVGAIVVPTGSYQEAAAVAGPAQVRVAGSLAELVLALKGEAAWPDVPDDPPGGPPSPPPDLADVRGQALARHALEVAAAGGHHLLLVGPPGAGKTMLAHRLVGLLPALDPLDALEVSAVWSAAGLGLPAGGLLSTPPLRAPHFSASTPAIVGGGTAWLRPGEASCAHHGCLFLDEMGEFPATVLDALRTPLEEGVVRVARARESVELPARFLLVGATNPCPCGDGGPPGTCRCSPSARARYLRRLSGPLIDRFDLRVQVTRPSPSELLRSEPGEATAVVRSRVLAARAIAAERGVRANADLDAAGLDEWAVVGEEAAGLLEAAIRAGRLSGRGLARVRAVARTLADLDGHAAPVLTAEHVALALALRQPVGEIESWAA